ncbi:hypothetical protein Poli38472_013512 [Pythium oligandrum]|uniref:Phospholipase/carboxylesterase/thioesterase domain-containing protein n=1 Tax=Pythium oligandrum TaxID=41045 RepID=A0A8K1C7W9_PYTOL|nr:hypothetical protein Poli38472_013512 [Pythium oligandrum]|eukprot:TMW58038.1 hypothetical protein Poli38472_013512 [Pythium oligandrum]
MNGYQVVRIHVDAGLALVRRHATDATLWVTWPRHAESSAADDAAVLLQAATSRPSPSLALRPADFVPRLAFEIVPSADGHDPQNLVVFLHGRGDSHVPFGRLAAQMGLPQTAGIALRAPLELPFDLGHTWLHDLDDDFNVIPPHVSHARRSQSLQEARKTLWHFLEILRDIYNWPLDRIFLFGFSQGACMAFDLVMTRSCRLGGVVLIAGGAIQGPHLSRDGYSEPSEHETPVLLISGSRDDQYPPSMVHLSEQHFTHKYKKRLWTRHTMPKRHEMIASRDEMQHVMMFFSEHLYLRNIALEERSDLIEITPQRR